jgi:Zn-dependent oligopeptidase
MPCHQTLQTSMQEEIEAAVVSLVQTRLRIAQLVGYKSYADYRLARGSLAQTQQAALTYLQRRQYAVASAACDEYTELEDFARKAGMYEAADCMIACDRSLLQQSCLTQKLHHLGLGEISTSVRT